MELHAELRQPRIKLNQYRRENKIPAVIYGHGFESKSILLDYNELTKVLQHKGEGSLVDLQIAGEKPISVVFQDYQRDILSGRLIHIDFYQIRSDEKLKSHITLKFVGEAPAVKSVGGVLIRTRDHIEVECLPKDLVPELEVDMSSLTDIHSSIKISDLRLPSGITVLHDKDLILITVGAPRQQEEETVVAGDAEKKAIEALDKKPEEEKEAKMKEEKEKK